MTTNLRVIHTRPETLRERNKQRAFQRLCGRLGITQSPGKWLTVTSKMVRDFKRMTSDSDNERPDAMILPCQSLVPHHLVLSLMDALTEPANPALDDACYHRGMKRLVDCGYERVNFTAPLNAGIRIRAAQALTMVIIHSSSIETRVEVVIESENDDTPVCIAERLYQLEF